MLFDEDWEIIDIKLFSNRLLEWEFRVQRNIENSTLLLDIKDT